MAGTAMNHGITTDTLPVRAPGCVPLLSFQREDVESRSRFRWCCWSRQIGKSFTKSLRRLLRGISRQRTQVFLSAGERQSRELMLKAQQHCRALNIAATFRGDSFFKGTRFRQLTIELPNGLRIIGLPANPLTARGFTGDVFLDEFAMHRHDREIWSAVFPTVLRGGGELDVASTPKGLDNMFAELRSNTSFSHSTVTLEEAIAAGLEVDADEIRRSINDDELYRQEFGCEFLDESSAFLTYGQIAAVEDASLAKSFNLPALGRCNGNLYAGVDIGRHRDLTVMWVVEAVLQGQVRKWESEEVKGKAARASDPFAGTNSGDRAGGEADVLVTRAVRETVGEPFAEQYAALRNLLSHTRLRRCCIDAGGMGMPLAEAAVEAFGSLRVEPVTFTAAVKDELATRLRLRIEAGTIRIPVDDAIRNDWHSLRRSVTAAGPARYETARSGSGHSDRFWAAALAVRAASAGSGVAEAFSSGQLRFSRAGIW